MSKHKRTHTLALHPSTPDHQNIEETGEHHDASDFIRAESEGMVTTAAPTANKPPLVWHEAVLAYLDVRARSLTQITLPALRRSATQQLTAHPFASLGLAVAAGAMAALILRPKLRNE